MILSRLVATLVLFVLAACGNDKEDDSVFDRGSETRSTKLVIKDLEVGNGKEAKIGDEITFHYTLWLASGRKIQSSYDGRGTPATFDLIAAQPNANPPVPGLIRGWTDGIPGMKEGGTRRLEVPASLGYGWNPRRGSGIPADADLVFEVKLLKVR